MTPADLERILRQPDMRAVNEHLLSATAAQAGRCKALPAADVWLDASTQSGASYGVSGRSWRNEREFMAAVFQEIDRMAILCPEYSLAFHVPNENAHRNPGVRGGYMDICWPIARGSYHCAWIELKVRDGKPSKLQLEVKHRLEIEGHFVTVIWDDLSKVMETMEWYRNL